MTLNISDDRHSVDASISAPGAGQCVSRNVLGGCIAYEDSTVGPTCTAWDVYVGCTSFRNVTGSGDVNFDFNVTLSATSSQAVMVSYSTADGTAIQGTDYAYTGGTLSFAPGETSKTITVRVYGRDYVGEHLFYVRLSNPYGALIADGEGVGTIVRSGGYGPAGNCPVGTYWNGYQCSAATGVGPPPDAGTSAGSGYSVTLTAAGNVMLTWSPITGATGYQLWLGTNACSNFSPYGAMQPATTITQTIFLSGTYCIQVRAQSGILAFITSATGATGGTAAAGGSISISAAACAAGDNCTFTVTQSGGSGPVSVSYSTQNGSATGTSSCPLTPNSAQDYVTTNGSVTVATNSTVNIVIRTCASGIAESIEVFTVNLTSTSAGSIVVSQGVGTISP